jgi:hypothetical protein
VPQVSWTGKDKGKTKCRVMVTLWAQWLQQFVTLLITYFFFITPSYVEKKDRGMLANEILKNA